MSAALALTEEMLPESLREIADVIGMEAAEKLGTVYGGRRLRFPRTIEADHELAELLGLEAARELCRVYGGERICVPSGVRRAQRDALIRHRLAGGEKPGTLADEYGLSERMVHYIGHG